MTSTPGLPAALSKLSSVAYFAHGRPDVVTTRAVVRAVDLGASVADVARAAHVSEHQIRRTLIRAAEEAPSIEW